jgi:hypothetical protein
VGMALALVMVEVLGGLENENENEDDDEND